MQTIKKILVIRLSSIGDIVLTTPLLRHLNKAYPEAHIDYCTKPPFVALLASNPRLSAIYTTEQLPTGSYDLVVDLQNNLRSQAIARSMKAGRVVQYRKENWKKWLLVNLKIDLTGTSRNVADRYLDSLKKLPVSGDHQGCELYPSVEERAFASPFFENSDQTLGLCFGANHFTKRYPPQHFAALLTSLLDKLPLQVLLLGGKDDAAGASEIMKAVPDAFHPRIINLAGQCSLMQTAALLERCDAVLCNDTGLMHIASAFGKKLFVLFGSSSSAFGFLPYHAAYKLFEDASLRCRPCSHIGRDHCPKGDFRCMNNLSPQLIAESIVNELKGFGRQ
ncbi:MAG: glycosyltransferase family 9 protein [Chlorobium sp.]|nr:MAG: glycosyltransferase family 9 protein [Chlorobium sp.]